MEQAVNLAIFGLKGKQRVIKNDEDVVAMYADYIKAKESLHCG